MKVWKSVCQCHTGRKNITQGWQWNSPTSPVFFNPHHPSNNLCHHHHLYPWINSLSRTITCCHPHGEHSGRGEKWGAAQQPAFMLTTPLARHPPPLVHSCSPTTNHRLSGELLQSIFDLWFVYVKLYNYNNAQKCLTNSFFYSIEKIKQNTIFPNWWYKKPPIN